VPRKLENRAQAIIAKTTARLPHAATLCGPLAEQRPGHGETLRRCLAIHLCKKVNSARERTALFPIGNRRRRDAEKVHRCLISAEFFNDPGHRVYVFHSATLLRGALACKKKLHIGKKELRRFSFCENIQLLATGSTKRKPQIMNAQIFPTKTTPTEFFAWMAANWDDADKHGIADQLDKLTDDGRAVVDNISWAMSWTRGAAS